MIISSDLRFVTINRIQVLVYSLQFVLKNGYANAHPWLYVFTLAFFIESNLIHLFSFSHRFPNVRLVSADYAKVQTPEYQQHRRPLSYRK